MSVVRNRKARHSAIGQVLLSLYDIVTDVLFLFEMIGRNGDGAYTSLIVVSVVFTGLAVAVNAVIAALFIKYGNKSRFGPAIDHFQLFTVNKAEGRLKQSWQRNFLGELGELIISLHHISYD